ncbi:MaoC family dehydratase N-terminal domain-containing protein [Nocardioides sp.]|uniref:MaoC family dehydratase n=1 Tax=Nocardioides sp. TaxID=35761 RepID=UPI0026040261|nr:MaoC family dehydratase N-terminal domain-containing protein [Nocardioides sp.]
MNLTSSATTAAPSLIPPEVAARVGTVAATATGDVYRRDWQRWAAAVGDLNPLWFDTDAARAAGYDDVVAPPLYVQYAILGVTPMGDLRADGSSGAASGNLAFPDAPRRMAGGESTTFLAPCYHGDTITMVRTIESIVDKQGRSGPFVLVTWRTTYTNQRDELVATASTSMIARP